MKSRCETIQDDALTTTNQFVAQVNRLSGQTVQLCYHCHKCSSGCPVVSEMEYGPDRLLRLLQQGEKGRLLRSRDIWLCASCEACGARCPNEIHVGQVIDALRCLALQEETKVALPEVALFHRLFLRLLRYLGRMHEASLLGLYLVRTGQLPHYVGLGVRMMAKGKVPLLPRGAGDRREIGEIFARSEAENE